MKPIGLFLRWVVIIEMLVGGALLFSAAAAPGRTKSAVGIATPTKAPTAVSVATGTATVEETAASPQKTNVAPTPTKVVATAVPPTSVPATKVSPTSAPGAAVEETMQCATKEVHVFTSPESKQDCGVLETAAEVTITGHKPGWYEISMEGWQPASSKSVVYAFEGIRIRTALLKECAQGNVKTLKTVTDPYTEQEWRQVKLAGVWVPEGSLAPKLDTLWGSASALYTKTCSACHALHPPKQYTANQWPGILKSMTPRTSLSKEQIEWVKRFLQYNAKDTSKAGTPLPCSTK